MRKLFSVIMIQTILGVILLAQPVSNYVYKLDNGINIKTENCWNHVWVQQSYAAMSAEDKTSPVTVNIRALGDLISSSSFKLINAGKEVRMQGAAPGTYDLKLTFKLSGKPGNLSCVIGNILIKEKTRTTVSVTLYDYQVLIDETPSSLNSLSSYQSVIYRSKGTTAQDMYSGVPTFYLKGKKDQPIPPEESNSKTKGKIKSGTYDLLLTIGISDQTHKVWLENFQMKPDINYKITVNLNAGVITYTGGNKDVKEMLLYPAGTGARQTGTPSPVKNLEIISYETVSLANCCSPGTYDVLLNFKNGTKYEWRNNVVIQTGIRTSVK
jgi:hypothetical protein